MERAAPESASRPTVEARWPSRAARFSRRSPSFRPARPSALAGLGADLSPKVARAQELRIARAKTTTSVCRYCSVGCSLLVHTVNDQIVNVEGNPASPINYGNLCPKGAAVFQLHVNPNRLTKTLYRPPGATEWEEVELDWAMDRVAQLVKQAPDGKTLMRTPSRRGRPRVGRF